MRYLGTVVSESCVINIDFAIFYTYVRYIGTVVSYSIININGCKYFIHMCMIKIRTSVVCNVWSTNKLKHRVVLIKKGVGCAVFIADAFY